MNPLLADPAQLLWTLGLTSLRAAVAFALLPPFAAAIMPAIVRMPLALAITFPPAMMALHNLPPMPDSLPGLVLLILGEGSVGLLIGLGLGAFCAGLQAVGEIIDHQTGQTFTQNIDPVHGNSVSITAQFLERVLFAALMSAGLLLVLADVLYVSYRILPVGGGWGGLQPLAVLEASNQAARLFALAILLAGPVVLVLFVVDISLGLLNRAAPQLNVYQVTLTLKSMLGLAVLGAALPLVLERVLRGMFEVSAALMSLLQRVGG
ncbi:MAG: EscT/YscT/HrcT family type III secretion system export apparatus protein [Pseudomonadota bacterium]|jgi:type III secretion protein T